MSAIDPVEFDVRLLRQQVRRQEVEEGQIQSHAKKVEDSASNVAEVMIEDDKSNGSA
jgi:hypothetical protein